VIPELVVTPWGARFRGRKIPCSIGRNGISTSKREGDGATPAGLLHVVGMLYRPDRIISGSLPHWAKPIGRRDLWSDDPADPDYNHPVRAPHRFSHEALRRPDPLYDLILVTDWNYPAASPGRGSAIFLHSWRRPRAPTAGCVAFAARDLLWIARRIPYGCRIRITV
jgi:L,D-peptidoglycan transpeptidase YkuD (ErfK/YbiS/YcfS/YnhG family)